MRRIGRYLFAFCAAVSLCTAVALGVIAVRSWFVVDFFSEKYWDPQLGRWSTTTVSWERGRLFASYQSLDLPATDSLTGMREPSIRRHHTKPPGEATLDSRWWVFEARGPGAGRGLAIGSTDRSYYLAVQLWPLTVLLLAPPALWLGLLRRARRRAHRLAGLCPECGYDLRASPDRCPECGSGPVVALRQSTWWRRRRAFT